MADIYELADAYRQDLEARTQPSVDRLLRSWEGAAERLQVEVSTLVKTMDAARDAGVEPSLSWLYRQERLQGLLRAIQREVTIWAPSASQEVRDAAFLAQDRAEVAAQALVTEAAAVSLPSLAATFVDIAPGPLAAITAHLAPGGPLAGLLGAAGTEAAEAATLALTNGVVMGKGTDWITRELRRALDIPRWRAETIARSEALRAYRETSRLTYQASNVVGSWTWLASIDRRTCAGCIVMDGTEHPLTERLDGHPRCRCVAVPRTKTWAQIDPALADLPDTRPAVRSGAKWLEDADHATQRAVMGAAKHEAFLAGEFGVDALVARTHSPKWGTMRRERSLAEIRSGRNANTVREPVKVAAAPEPVAVDPIHGVPEADLRSRLTSGSMAERRAAQTELVRRKDAEMAQYQAERQAKLARYAGDGKTWNQVPDMPVATWQRGRHTAIVADDLGDNLQGFLDDVGSVLDKLPLDDLRPITFRVPKGDRVFGGRGTGLTGGYVTEGLDFVNINPAVARGLDLDGEKKAAQFMPGSERVTLRQWTIAHELGHIMDHGHGHTHEARASGAVWRKLKGGLSRYGRSHRAEGYAEAWAQWLHGGPGSDPVADAYAKEYGWPGAK